MCIILHPAAEFRPNRTIHCGKMTSYQFSRWRLSALSRVVFALVWGHGGHPRSAFHGLNSVLKSLVRGIDSSGDHIAMYRLSFWLKLPIHAPFWGVFGAYFPIWRHPSSVRVVNEKKRERRAPREWGLERGLSPSPMWIGLAVPPPQIFFWFFIWQWCILVHSGRLF